MRGASGADLANAVKQRAEKTRDGVAPGSTKNIDDLLAARAKGRTIDKPTKYQETAVHYLDKVSGARDKVYKTTEEFWGKYGTYITGAMILFASVSITTTYYFKPEWYFVVPITMVLCMTCYNFKDNQLAKHVGLGFGIGLVIFFVLRVMSTNGILGDKGWLDKNYCKDIKEDDDEES